MALSFYSKNLLESIAEDIKPHTSLGCLTALTERPLSDLLH